MFSTRVTYGKESGREPTMGEDETLVFDEHGRIYDEEGCNYGVCYQSHYFRVTKGKYGGYRLLVKHGGGEERIDLGHNQVLIDSLALLPSDYRYRVLSALHHLYRDGQQDGRSAMELRYRTAFINGHLKKRKRPGRESYKVWIETPIQG